MVDKVWVGGTNSWQSSGSSAATRWSPSGIPTSSDNVIFNSTSGASTVTVNGTVVCANLTTIGFTGIITGGASGLINVYGGSINLGESEIFDPSNTPKLGILSGGTTTLTSNAQTVGGIFIDNQSILKLNDDLTTFNDSTITINSGFFNANNNNVCIGILTDNTGAALSKGVTLGSGSWTLGWKVDLGGISNQYVWKITNPTYFTLDVTNAKPIKLQTYNGISRIRTAISSSDTSIRIYGAMLEGGTSVPFGWPVSGIVMIGDEQIYYSSSSINAVTDATLDGCIRGFNGTTAVDHNKYTPVLRINPTGYGVLAADLDSSSTTDISIVGDNSGFGGTTGTGYLIINGEMITYTSKPTTNSFSGIVRGANSTTATTHKKGEYVRACEYRVFAGGDGITYPKIISWNNDEYVATDITGNQINFSNKVGYNNLGSQKITVNGTPYYINEPGFNEDALEIF